MAHYGAEGSSLACWIELKALSKLFGQQMVREDGKSWNLDGRRWTWMIFKAQDSPKIKNESHYNWGYSGLPLSADVHSAITSWLGLKNYPKFTLEASESAYWFLSYSKVVFHCQLMCTVPSRVYWAWKTTPNWPLKHQNLPTGSWVMVRSSSIVSWCVQWHHEWTWLKKLPKNDSSNIKIGPQDQKLQSKFWNGEETCLPNIN